MFQRQSWMYRAGEYPSTDQEYFALLARAIFSAGLGPRVVESRWAGLQQAFFEFEPKLVAQMTADDVSRLLSDASVIRNRRKIEAVIAGASVFLEVTGEAGSFHEFLVRQGAAAGTLDGVMEVLSSRFVHLGRASALLFLFSAGFRQREDLTPEGAVDAAALVAARAPEHPEASMGAAAPDAPDAAVATVDSAASVAEKPVAEASADNGAASQGGKARTKRSRPGRRTPSEQTEPACAAPAEGLL